MDFAPCLQANTNMDKCKECRKKTLMPFRCQCDKVFCITHRMPEDHACGFDFQKAGQIHLEKQNPKVVSSKLAYI